MLYHIEKDESGKIIGIRKRKHNSESEYEEAVIKEDYQDQAYCDFLTWASRIDKDWGEDYVFYQRPCQFFATKAKLIDYCKLTGTMLWIRFEDNNKYFDCLHGTMPAGSRVPGHFENGLQNGFAALATASPSSGDVIHKSGLDKKNGKIYVTFRALEEMNNELNDESSDSRRVSNLPIIRSFVYLDVSDFSAYAAGLQASVINSIVRVLRSETLWLSGAAHSSHSKIEAMICIGDGYIFVFRQPDNAALFAASMAYFIERLIAQGNLSMIPVEFHFRFGIHSGPVYCFWDPGRNGWNYIGDGINGGQRVLSAAGKEKDDVIYVSGDFRKLLHQRKFDTGQHMPLLRKALHNRGRHMDKHGGKWRIYEMNHEEVAATFLVPMMFDEPLLNHKYSFDSHV